MFYSCQNLNFVWGIFKNLLTHLRVIIKIILSDDGNAMLNLKKNLCEMHHIRL